MTLGLIVSLLIAYITILFWVARIGEKTRENKDSWTKHPIVYALALGVYCTSWTFYGLVGTASSKGWNFLPILLGPILAFTFGYPILKRISTICRQERIHSIADFVASRYGKRQGIATTITLIVLIATIPYIALQLKAVSSTLYLAIENNQFDTLSITLAITISMIVFTVLVSTRQLDVSGYHPGLMAAIAFESIVKLVAFGLIVFASIRIMNTEAQPANVDLALTPFQNFDINLRFVVETFISACAVFCLPRMFHIAFVEQLSSKHLRTARWAFSLYLALIIICIFIIAWAGNSLFLNTGIKGDNFVLALPLSIDATLLTAIAFLGGFSAATAMIIVATVTLSRMLSNDVILPLLLKHKEHIQEYEDYSTLLLIIRRITIVLIIALAFIYYRLLAENVALTSIGLIAFALAVQLMPAVLIGIFWKNGNYKGVYAGLITGTSIWFYALMIPLLSEANLISASLLEHGLFNITWLRPEYLFNLDFSDAFTRAVIISLSVNTFSYFLFSNLGKPLLIDRVQANAFVDFSFIPKLRNSITNISYNDLESLLKQFIGEQSTKQFFSENKKTDTHKVDTHFIKLCEQQLASVAGVATARRMINSLGEDSNLAVEDLFSIFEETTRALRFNQDMLYASFESISSAISICDADLKMIAWNKPYESLFKYPEGMLIIGRPVQDLLQHNASKGFFGRDDANNAIQKRLYHLRNGRSYRVIRSVSDALILEIKGTPLPNGGYVTTYDDITDFMHTQAALEEANMTLEARVIERTKTIEEINHNLVKEINQRKYVESELIKAKAEADLANADKSKFLAQASHDILQPLNAANLYVSALEENKNLGKKDRITAQHLKSSIKSSENIISTLLEISRLDTGTLKPKPSVFMVNDILQSLVEQFSVLTNEGVELSYIKSQLWIRSDKDYLTRVIQNLLSNAIKYTQFGKIVIGCRRTKNTVRISIYDTGVGISKKDLPFIRDDFYRCNTHLSSGTGLGLAVASRFCTLLKHELRVTSEVNKGSHFSVTVDRADKFEASIHEERTETKGQFTKIKVLYIDDNFENLDATATLLNKWNCSVKTCLQPEISNTVYEKFKPHLVLMDYQLGENIDGISLCKSLLANNKHQAEFCIVSAAADVDIESLAANEGLSFLRKPVKPAKLRALLTQQANKIIEPSND